MSLTLDIPAQERSADGVPRLGGYAVALAMVAAATVLAVAVEQQVRIPNLSLVFVLPVVVAAALFGWGPALAAALAGVVAYNFFLIPPLYTFRVADPDNVWALVLLLAVAAITSAVAAQSRRRALAAQAAAGQAQALQELARALVAATDRPAVAAVCAEALARLFAAPAVVLAEGDAGLDTLASAGGARVGEADREAARWALASRLSTRGGAYPVGEAAFDFWPVMTARRQGAVLGVAISGAEQGRPAAPERLVELVGAYLAVALDREALAGEVLEARVASAGERLKADLLAAVSHDLKTPLSSVLVSLQSLRAFGEQHDAATRAELLALAETETARLGRLVEDLLDTGRLDAGAVRPHTAVQAPADLIAAALDQAAPALAGRRVETETAVGRLLRVDAGLFESALAKVLENAGRYGPEGSRVLIRAGGGGGEGWIEVEDEGPGFTGPIEPLFSRFTRGVPGDGRPPGLGLGLSIARGFMVAMGGRIEAANREGGVGARVRLVAPAAGPAGP
jgi:two-component system sensor histidine kinase KdpD